MSRLRTLNVDRLNKRKYFDAKKARSKRHPEKTIIDADYAYGIEILANTPIQAETLLCCLEQTTGGIGLKVNANKTEYTYFNQEGDISTHNDGCLKLVDKFT